MTTAVLSALIRPLVEPRLPDWVEPLWFMSKEEAIELAPRAEIGWFDFNQPGPMCEVVTAATNLKWLNSIYAGLDFLPLDQLRTRSLLRVPIPQSGSRFRTSHHGDAVAEELGQLVSGHGCSLMYRSRVLLVVGHALHVHIKHVAFLEVAWYLKGHSSPVR